MQLSFASVFLSVALASTVSAGPVFGRQDNQKSMGPAEGSSVGAAYFITNEATGNFIVAADIGADGKLSLRTATGTGGLGAHGLPANGPDPLFTQGAVKASSSGNIVASVNAGSNTLSMLGRPVGSGGEFPVSLAINKAGNSLCALNGDFCFKIDKKLGLMPIPNTTRSLKLNQTTPATGPAGSASHVVFTEDNTQLVASVKGVPPQPGFLAVWDVASDGSLSTDFQSRLMLVGFDIFDFGNLNTAGSASNGTRSSAVGIDGQSATCWSSFSPKTGNFYLTDIGTSIVTEVNVDENLRGTIVKQYNQGNESATIDNDIASVGKNDFMYVLAANATAINVLSLNGPGEAESIQKVDIAAPAKVAGLTISASNLQGMTTFIKK
ncbi:hypothetical protein BD779DRAFT_1608605 [Infundibulicybe gibba]|nr:hypothetical protein BD779DRAFT_1608605 [Infundibulicybe gibba]